MKGMLWAAMLLSMVSSMMSCRKQLVGSGRLVYEERNIQPFSSIENNGDFVIKVSQSALATLRLYGEDNILPEIVTEVKNNRLAVWYRPVNIRHRHEQVVISVTTPSLDHVSISGSGSVESSSLWQPSQMFTNISGSGTMDLPVKTTYLTGTVSGSGNLTLRGETNQGNYTVSGSGKIRAFDVTAKEVSATISGSGTTEVYAIDKLNATISGSGNIYYKGSPAINYHLSGSGKLVKQ